MNWIEVTYYTFVIGFAIVLIGMAIWIGVCLHLAYTRMDEILGFLKNCSAVMNRAPLRHGGPWGKLLLIGGISGIVTFPGVYLKYGGVSVEDLKRFPTQLKRKLAVLQWCVIVLLVMMCVLVVGMKFLKEYVV